MNGAEYVFYIDLATAVVGLFYAYWMIAHVPNCKPNDKEKFEYLPYITWGLTITIALFIVTSVVIAFIGLVDGTT